LFPLFIPGFPLFFFTLFLTMSSSSSFLFVLVLIGLLSLSLASPASPRTFPRFGGSAAVDANAPGVTLQLFIDPVCSTNISDVGVLAATLSNDCQVDEMQLFSMIINCQVDATQTTHFTYNVWQNNKCSGLSMMGITADGKGPCIPASMTQNGVKAPVPLYAKVSCSAADQQQQVSLTTTESQSGRFHPKAVMEAVQALVANIQ